ncbi:hypothetical protein KSP35_14915 [Aquihabitans sp. G128]|uniref:hypothetical protein n=1 Tax=Aquihabitans sp. G128 TaxID=2849779 RepID=UPI001C24A03A|nr:hypothetical protein [Aquihabitans sp. G128]QXC59670.1 hypothetical protein KSP35_14915 [Aquihabitans sp. G128]
MAPTRFDVIWEVDPPVRPDLGPLHAQLDVVRDVATAVLVPDNHTGRATVSSIAVAERVNASGAHAIACLNARDRNLLGLRRDLLTCMVGGVDDLLLVYGDEPEVGERAPGVTVRSMLEECRSHRDDLRVGVTSRLGPLPAWKREAHQLFVQVSWSIDELLRWRETVAFDGPIHPAVLVVPSAAMARRLSARVPELRVPEAWIDAVAADPAAGVELAAELVEQIRTSGAFAGVHLVAGVRHRELAARLGHPATSRTGIPA